MLFRNKQVVIGGKSFEQDVFEYLLNRFKEAFSHSSLTIESAFKELDDLNRALKQNMSEEANEYFQLLSSSEKKNILDVAKQIIVFKGSRFGVITEQLDGTQKQVNKLFADYFRDFESYFPYYIKYDADGNFDRVATFHSLDSLFLDLPARTTAYSKAYNMQKDHLDAFDYAIELDKITVPNIIEINNIVNRSDSDRVEGFKKTNNDIVSASFTPTDKKNVPYEMQRLLAEYENGFGEELLDYTEPDLTTEERMRRIYQLFRREALFHIRFERIHPFNDGNGRTGRIIMNHNLLKQGLAPVIVTNFMSRDYKKYINDYDVDGLTQMLVNSSSQQMANWVSMNKAGISVKKSQISPDNSKLAALDGYQSEDDKKKNLLKKIDSMMIF